MQRRNVMNCVSILSLQSPHQFTPTLDVQDTKLSTFVLAGG
ncbi:peptide-methionine (S)-S-oxide reductase, partial [Escherichia coli]|nr:peptide-methionine (S)-S-oxide reductase [Escherichia coli]